MLGYHLVLYFLRHHDETNLRPKFLDHTLAMTLVGAVGAAVAFGGSPKHIGTGALFFAATLAPMTYWLSMQGMKPGSMYRHPKIFYTDDATPEEIERFRNQDVTDMLAHEMHARPGYGYFTRDARHM
jgi:hypothetical protein